VKLTVILIIGCLFAVCGISLFFMIVVAVVGARKRARDHNTIHMEYDEVI
jgi:hypothetical protein